VQRLLGHAKWESTARYFGVEVDNALEISDQTEAKLFPTCADGRFPPPKRTFSSMRTTGQKQSLPLLSSTHLIRPKPCRLS
jgi:hypothetical protein